MIVFVDKYSKEVVYLLKTLQNFDPHCKVLVFEDNFFFPQNIYTTTDILFSHNLPTKNVYYAFLNVPPFWQIHPEGVLGAIYDMDEKMATIYFTEPIEQRHVQRVEWLSREGYVYKIDYYNKYGFVQCRELRSKEGHTIQKSYYSDKQEEILTYNVPDDITITYENHRIKDVYDCSLDYEKSLYMKFITSGEKIILTTLRQVEVMCQVDTNHTASCNVLLNTMQDIQTYSKQIFSYPVYILTNADTSNSTPIDAPRICYCNHVFADISSTGDALILTMSDQIESIEPLITYLPEMTFHIAANTAVSEKLLSLQNHPNVKIYPQISMEKLQHLLDISSYYLDINYGYEIHNAIIETNLNHLLILGFKNTLHNPYYTLDECIFLPEDFMLLIETIKTIRSQKELLESLLYKQSHLSDSVIASLECNL